MKSHFLQGNVHIPDHLKLQGGPYRSEKKFTHENLIQTLEHMLTPQSQDHVDNSDHDHRVLLHYFLLVKNGQGKDNVKITNKQKC